MIYSNLFNLVVIADVVLAQGRRMCRMIQTKDEKMQTRTYSREAMMIVRYRPRKASAMKAPRRGRSDAVPDQALTFSAAVAVDCPKGPVKYVIKFELTP